MENPFKKAVKDKEKTKEIEEGVSADIEAAENKVEEVVEQAPDEQVADDKGDAAKQEEMTEEVNPLQDKYDALNNQYIRLSADFDNYRKRNEKEKEALLQYGAENTLKKLLGVIDNFERGLKAIETMDDCEKVKECYKLAYKNFTEALTKAGLEPIQAEGEIFDTNLHEAVMRTPTTEKPDNTVIAELQKGYKLGDKVLRPTLVNVATEG